MNIISIRVNDDEMSILQNASKLYSGNVSSMIKKIVFDKLEDDYDIKSIIEYEEEKKAGKLEARNVEDVCNGMGLNWDAL